MDALMGDELNAWRGTERPPCADSHAEKWRDVGHARVMRCDDCKIIITIPNDQTLRVRLCGGGREYSNSGVHQSKKA